MKRRLLVFIRVLDVEQELGAELLYTLKKKTANLSWSLSDRLETCLLSTMASSREEMHAMSSPSPAR